TRKGKLSLPLKFKLRAASPGGTEIRARFTLYYCREDDTGVCRVKTLVWRAPVEVTDAAGAPREMALRAKVE
ncbi:MAG TPA: hypothetical protein VE642_05880, partial [Pyrinomonadaceae bacterium]|nr:hypothetical protein [Pyrinomonadaceae bacterium]